MRIIFDVDYTTIDNSGNLCIPVGSDIPFDEEWTDVLKNKIEKYNDKIVHAYREQMCLVDIEHSEYQHCWNINLKLSPEINKLIDGQNSCKDILRTQMKILEKLTIDINPALEERYSIKQLHQKSIDAAKKNSKKIIKWLKKVKL